MKAFGKVLLALVVFGVVAYLLWITAPATKTKTPTPTPQLAWLSCKDCADAGMLINLWDTPARGKVTGQLPHGSRVTIVDSQEGHYLVSAQGQRGWVSSRMISFTQPAD